MLKRHCCHSNRIFRVKCMPPQTKHQHVIQPELFHTSFLILLHTVPFPAHKNIARYEAKIIVRKTDKNLAPHDYILLLSAFPFWRRPSSTWGRVGAEPQLFRFHHTQCVDSQAISRTINRVFFSLSLIIYWCTRCNKSAICFVVKVNFLTKCWLGKRWL